MRDYDKYTPRERRGRAAERWACACGRLESGQRCIGCDREQPRRIPLEFTESSEVTTAHQINGRAEALSSKNDGGQE